MSIKSRNSFAVTSIVLAAFVLQMAASAQEPKPAALQPKVEAATTASNDASKGAPMEKDKRIQSHGLPWRFEKAIIANNPTRPRVLLVGDSILNGYLPYVTSLLDGKAYVDVWVNPYYHSENFNRMLAQNLTNGPYAIVHINLGLHGFTKGRIPPGQFESLTRALIEVIRKECPKAKIIWATTTPILTKDKPARLDPELNPIIVGQNQIAKKLMAEMQVQVDDLYLVATNQLDLSAGDQFHWQSPGYKVFAAAAVKEISAALAAGK
ncbi:MAG: hypothetical protein JWR19_1090 [Pedosphaera sp.]|nr:hypothetical protein [Pedosphaera sp.]